MDITLQPGKLSGSVAVPPSKSIVHRMLICAAFSHQPSTIFCTDPGQDIEATADCLQALGAEIRRSADAFQVIPVKKLPDEARLNCRESGSTLRFLLPIVGALGVETAFEMEGRLPQRPLFPLWEEMERMGCRLYWESDFLLRCCGKLRPGAYRMDGSISSQFISGLMMALPLIHGQTDLKITGTVESKPYIRMTQHVLDQFSGTHPAQLTPESDWSSAAFWMAANALGSNVEITGLNNASLQGDRAVTDCLPKLRENTAISAKDIPDLIPVLSVVAAAGNGAVFSDIGRLRYKESDRVSAIAAMLESLGGKAEATEDTLTIFGTGLIGGIVDSYADHRIAMSAAIAATVCNEPVTVLGAECVKKSYPGFWEAYASLGGHYEKQLR
ncbi:MAG: 3-phosphoshikimate 1-carboxyvinyltransferase [Ruminococcaceae bacterium]|nr:3-phosphoshikimate 1-carboxyvinyltransferase [Oscillospiraceae bacterium]